MGGGDRAPTPAGTGKKLNWADQYDSEIEDTADDSGAASSQVAATSSNGSHKKGQETMERNDDSLQRLHIFFKTCKKEKHMSVLSLNVSLCDIKNACVRHKVPAYRLGCGCHAKKVNAVHVVAFIPNAGISAYCKVCFDANP